MYRELRGSIKSLLDQAAAAAAVQMGVVDIGMNVCNGMGLGSGKQQEPEQRRV